MNLRSAAGTSVALGLLLAAWASGARADGIDGVCKSAPAGTLCQIDGNKCTTDECDGKGSCVHLPKRSCDDGDVCTDDACNPATGACVHRPDSSNDPVCTPGSDVKVRKDARCTCVGEIASADERSDDGGPTTGDGIVYCERDEIVPFVDDSAASCFIGYTITVKNKAAGGVTGVQVADVLPSAVRFQSSTASQGSYDPETGLWDVGALGSAGMAMLNIVVTAGSSPDGAMIDAAVTGYSRDGGSDDRSSDDQGSGDHGSGDKSDDGESEDSGSHDSKSEDSTSDDGSSDDRPGKLIRNCADLIAVAPPDTNPINDSDCVVVSLATSKCDGGIPPWVKRKVDRTSRLLTAAARTSSTRRAARLARRAARAIERTSVRIDRLGTRGHLHPDCVDWLHGEIGGLADEARHLAP